MLLALGNTEADLAYEGRNLNIGSHELIINKITEYLVANKKDSRTFNTNIIQLKRLRVSADYENIEADIKKGRDSILLSDMVLKHLKSNVKI